MKESVINEIKFGQIFKKSQLFVTFEEYFYSSRHLVIVYEDLRGLELQQIKS